MCSPPYATGSANYHIYMGALEMADRYLRCLRSVLALPFYLFNSLVCVYCSPFCTSVLLRVTW